MQRVMEITALALNRREYNQVEILAEGTVPSSGWLNACLVPWRYVMPPSNGIQDFDLQAEEPTDAFLPFISTVNATLAGEVDVENYWGKDKPLTGVRVHARSGSKEAVLQAEPMGDERWVPWPWNLRNRGGAAALVGDWPVSDLLGRPVRIYRQGDPVTADQRPDRVNIVLRPNESVIAHIKLG